LEVDTKLSEKLNDNNRISLFIQQYQKKWAGGQPAGEIKKRPVRGR
jgi:hypothetical protein